jgi:hypothetical protein
LGVPNRVELPAASKIIPIFFEWLFSVDSILLY